jgi:acetate kinase
MIDAETEAVLAKGQAQRIGLDLGEVEHEVGGESFVQELPLANHVDTLAEIVALFAEHGPSLADVVAVAHRTVHGGDKFSAPTLITDEVIDTLSALSPLAPLHNPPGIDGIVAARQVLPDVPHIAVFDTAFFTTLPAEAYTYAIPAQLAADYSIRKYGFHGTSHKFVSEKVTELVGRPIRQIVCHLGNGASLSAVNYDGHPIDTTLGLTPNQGLVMGTRSGDVDPGLHKYLMTQAGLSIDEVDEILNKRSGLLGLTGSSDMRDVRAADHAGDPVAHLAREVYVHRVVFYIGAYATLLGGVDAITFTAGVGENDPSVRSLICARLGLLGVELDAEANEASRRDARVISSAGSAVTVLVVPTNEELSMARQAAALIG